MALSLVLPQALALALGIFGSVYLIEKLRAAPGRRARRAGQWGAGARAEAGSARWREFLRRAKSPDAAAAFEESLSGAMESLSEEAAWYIGRLGAQYAGETKGPDAFFRSVVRLLKDADARDIDDLRRAIQRARAYARAGLPRVSMKVQPKGERLTFSTNALTHPPVDAWDAPEEPDEDTGPDSIAVGDPWRLIQRLGRSELGRPVPSWGTSGGISQRHGYRPPRHDSRRDTRPEGRLMRYAPLALLLALGCAADPVLLPDSGPCSSACGAGTVCQAGACVAVDAGGDAASDGSASDAADAGVAVCIPACAAGQRCESGACVAFDAGVDAGVDVPPLSDAALATALHTCEPIGSECAPGVMCLAGYFADAGTRGICTIPCADDPTRCERFYPESVCGSQAAGAANRACVLRCNQTNRRCPDGFGECRPVDPLFPVDRAFCAP